MLNLPPGQMLGPYKIINQIGQGGMATVYKAYHASMDRYVALKVLSHQFAFSKEFYNRFQHEARLIARLEHPHILPVYDFGESNGIPYLVMRFLEAGTLKDRLEAGPLPLPEINRIFIQLVEALGYAHENGIIHRDIKPSNAMLDKRGEVFLTDFGIAKLVEGSPQFTATGAITGTPAYMSPEQAQGLKIDQRSDLYSIGIVLYEMITGHVPYEAETPLAVILKQIQEPLPPLSTIRPDIHPAIEAFVLKTLAKTPEERYTNTVELLAAWKQAFQEAISTPVTQAQPKPAPVSFTPPPKPESPRLSQPVQPPAVARASQSQPVFAPPPSPEQPVEAPPVHQSPLERIKSAGGRKNLVLSLASCAGVIVLVCICAVAFRIIRNRNIPAEPTDVISMAAPPSQTPEVGEKVGGQWTSWTAANSVLTILLRGEEIFAGGEGGVTIWNKRDKTYQHITVQNGLPGPMVTSILSGKENNSYWVSTDEGIGYYNGSTWTYYSYDQGLDGAYVSDITLVNDTLWAATFYSGFAGGGLNRFNGERWEQIPGFPSLHEDDPNQENPGTLSYNVNKIIGDENNHLWVATTAGVGYFDGQNWTVFDKNTGLANENITAMRFDSKSRLWLGAADGSVYELNGNAFDLVSNLSEYGIYTISGIVEDNAGLIWFSASGGVASLNPDNDGWTLYTKERTNFPAYDMTAVVKDENGVLFFGSRNEGLLSYSGEFKAWTVPNSPKYLGYASVFPARNNELWFVKEYGNSQIDILNTANSTWSVPVESDICCPIPLAWSESGDLYSGGYEGLYITTPNHEQTNFGAAQGLPSEFVTAVAFTPDGQTWIGTDLGLAVFDGKQIINILTSADGLPGNYIHVLKLASDGSLWVGSDKGVSHRLPSGEWIYYYAGKTFNESMEMATDIAEAADGALWVTTGGDGIYRLASDEWKRFSVDDGSLPGSGNYFTSAALAQDGSLWFGAYWEGALRYSNDTWTSYDIQDGLAHPNVTDIYTDPSGAVWFATSGGASRWTP